MNQTRSSALASEFENVTVSANQVVLDRSDLVFLGLMAEAVKNAAEILTIGLSAAQ